MTDFSAPLDQIHADCLAQQRIIRDGFAREAESIRLRGDQFAAEIEAAVARLVAGADGWDAAQRLAEQAAYPVHRRDRPCWHPDDCNGQCCWTYRPTVNEQAAL